MPVADKTKEDRLKETIRLLKELQKLNFSDVDLGYREVKALLTQWVSDGVEVDAKVEFARHGRLAVIHLPKGDDKAASIALKVVQ